MLFTRHKCACSTQSLSYPGRGKKVTGLDADTYSALSSEWAKVWQCMCNRSMFIATDDIMKQDLSSQPGSVPWYKYSRPRDLKTN